MWCAPIRRANRTLVWQQRSSGTSFCATQNFCRQTDFLPCIGAGQETAGGVGPSATPAGLVLFCRSSSSGASPEFNCRLCTLCTRCAVFGLPERKPQFPISAEILPKPTRIVGALAKRATMLSEGREVLCPQPPQLNF